MLYPDLRRLSLVCPTGMPLPSGTHNHEAGGSNDPPPPPVDGPAQREALAQADVVSAILLALGDGDFADVCKSAARWCHLNKTNMAACDDGVWEQLTSIVFPNARKPNTGRHGRSDAPWNGSTQQPPPDEPERPKDWFFHICTQYKKRVDLIEAWHKTVIKRAKTQAVGETLECVKLLLGYNKLEHKVRWYQNCMHGVMAGRGPMGLQLRLANNIEWMQNEMAALSDELDEKCFSNPALLTGYLGQPRTEDETRLLEALDRQKAYLRDINQDPEMQGPHTLGDEILRSRISWLEFAEAKHKREREEQRGTRAAAGLRIELRGVAGRAGADEPARGHTQPASCGGQGAACARRAAHRSRQGQEDGRKRAGAHRAGAAPLPHVGQRPPTGWWNCRTSLRARCAGWRSRSARRRTSRSRCTTCSGRRTRTGTSSGVLKYLKTFIDSHTFQHTHTHTHTHRPNHSLTHRRHRPAQRAPRLGSRRGRPWPRGSRPARRSTCAARAAGPGWCCAR